MKLPATLLLILLPFFAFSQENADTSYKDAVTIGMGIHYNYWSPQGNLSMIGESSGLGFKGSFGVFNYFMVNLQAVSRFKRATSSPILYYNGDSVTISNTINDYSVFISLDYSLLKFSKFVIYPNIGIGQHTIVLDNATNTKRKSLLITTGAGIKYRVGKYFETFTEGRYNVIGKKDIGGSNMAGNAISFNIGLLFVIPAFESINP